MRYLGLFLILLSVITCNRSGLSESSTKNAVQLKVIAQGEVIELQDYVKANTITVFDFYADWCPPCIRLNKSLVNIKTTYGDRVEILKLDIVDWDSPLAQHFRIKDLPFLMVYDGDKKLLKAGQSKDALPFLVQNLNQ